MVKQYEKYLGLPSFIGRKKKKKRIVLTTLNKGSRKNFKGGKANSYHKRGEKVQLKH